MNVMFGISSHLLRNFEGQWPALSASLFWRSKGPLEPSPGLSAAMPWVKTYICRRPKGAREIFKYQIETHLSRPFRALRFFTAFTQGIALRRSALGWVLAARWAARAAISRRKVEQTAFQMAQQLRGIEAGCLRPVLISNGAFPF